MSHKCPVTDCLWVTDELMCKNHMQLLPADITASLKRYRRQMYSSNKDDRRLALSNYHVTTKLAVETINEKISLLAAI